MSKRKREKDSNENNNKRTKSEADFPNTNKSETPEHQDSSIGFKQQGNSYSGYTVPSDGAIERVSISELTPQDFFTRFVAKRKPVILVGTLPDPQWNADKWTNKYLKSKIGEKKVEVEKRDGVGQYGKGNRVLLKFSEFLDSLSSGDQSYYLTTQTEVNEAGRVPLIPFHLQPLLGDFPIKPLLVGNLVPATVNIWMGHSNDWATSGLHHDFHDNLYVLLRGVKRFTLFSPQDALSLYTNGEIAGIHANGLINYCGEESNADGTWFGVEQDVVKQQKIKEQQKRLEEATKALDDGDGGAEDLIDNALGAFLEGASEDEDEDEQDDDELLAKEAECTSKNTSKGTTTKDKGDPFHFSKIDLNQPRDKIIEQFPKFSTVQPLKFEVKSGEILYLPSGWFHNVESVSTDTTSTATSGKQGKSTKKEQETGHFAFNYWFHPPDTQDYAEPYSTKFWALDFEQLMLDDDDDDSL